MLFVHLFSNLFLSIYYVLDIEAISFFSVRLFFFFFLIVPVLALLTGTLGLGNW